MPIRVATYNALGWIGLLAIIFGTLLQAIAVLDQK